MLLPSKLSPSTTKHCGSMRKNPKDFWKGPIWHTRFRIKKAVCNWAKTLGQNCKSTVFFPRFIPNNKRPSYQCFDVFLPSNAARQQMCLASWWMIGQCLCTAHYHHHQHLIPLHSRSRGEPGVRLKHFHVEISVCDATAPRPPAHPSCLDCASFFLASPGRECTCTRSERAFIILHDALMLQCPL